MYILLLPHDDHQALRLCLSGSGRVRVHVRACLRAFSLEWHLQVEARVVGLVPTMKFLASSQ